jgi:DNA polymerase, archaea type
MAENMGFEVLHGIVDCLWVIGEPISVYKEAVEKETGILTEVDTYDWIAFLPMSDGGGAYNRYFGRLNTGKMKIRGVMARKGDTPEYVNKMQQEVFEVLAEARSLEELRKMESKARQVYRRYMDELESVDVKELAIHRRVSRLNYSRRCAEASAVQAHMKQGISLAPGMEIGYVIRDARKWRQIQRELNKSSMLCFIEDCCRRLGRGSFCVFAEACFSSYTIIRMNLIF